VGFCFPWVEISTVPPICKCRLKGSARVKQDDAVRAITLLHWAMPRFLYSTMKIEDCGETTTRSMGRPDVNITVARKYGSRESWCRNSIAVSHHLIKTL
jgi:hypothetical protein